MDSQTVRYIIIIVVNILMLGVYINDYARWNDRIRLMPLSFTLISCRLLRFVGLLVVISNMFVYIVGSFSINNKLSQVADIIFCYLCVTIVTSVAALLVSSEGFKRQNKLVRIKFSRED